VKRAQEPGGAPAQALDGAAPALVSELGDWHRHERRSTGVVFVVAVVLLALLCSAVVGVMSAARAYVGGESLYSKGQKNASRFLEHYIDAGDEADYRRFNEQLALPLGDGLAQTELDKPAPDYARVRAGLLQGGNDAADLACLIAFYRLLRHAPHVAEAIATWAAADRDLLRLQALGERVHERRQARGGAADDAQRRVDRAELNRLDEALDAQENRFAQQLGAAARSVQDLLLLATIALAALLILAGLLFARMLWRRLARSQRAMAEVNTKWALAAEAGQLGLMEWRAGSDTVLLDARACAIFELDPARSAVYGGQELRRLVCKEDRRPARRAALQAIAEKRPLVHRVRVELASGRHKHVEVDARAFLSDAGSVTHAVGVLRDVTSEVMARNVLLEEDAAQRTYKARREFLSRVSHELRTPLNAVIGFSDLMRSDSAEPLSATQRARLDRVVDGGQYLLRLVNDLLDVARLEVGELSVALGSVRLAGVLRSAIELLDADRLARGIAIEVREPAPGLRVVADPVRLKQVFVNVLSNAIKYNRPGGTVHVGCMLTSTQAVVTIRDEGAGMSPLQQRELFIPFRRLGDGQHASEGAGLGLVISRHLAERQGGSLDIASTPQKGSTVTIRLQRDVHAPDAVTEPASLSGLAPLEPGAAGVVVYVEDDPVNVMLIEQYAALCPDVKLLVARDGRSGLELARLYLPHLILLDMQLPDMTGLDVLDQLRADPLTSGLRVVALSADAMPAQITEAIAHGAEAYWTKPLALDKFKRELPKFLH